jgi:hypothetical protein
LGLGRKAANTEYQKPCPEIRIDEVLAQAKRIEGKGPEFNEVEKRGIDKLLQAAKDNRQCLFNSLSDSEAFSLAKALCRLNGYFEDGRNSILLWDSFLKRFPRSSHLDEARWLRAKQGATPDEYEGFADAALQQIKSIEVFIKDNPANSSIPEAELELARACRIAYETFRYGDGLSTSSKMDRQEAGRKYRDRAKQLLQHLCNEASDPARAEACLALRELNKGQCVHMGPGSPNPHFQDRWAASNGKR